MRQDAQVTVHGYVATELTVRQAQNGGKRFCRVTVAHQRSRRSQNGPGYEAQGGTTWYQAMFYEEQADLVANMLRKGSPVILVGTPEVKPYLKNGEPAAGVDMVFPTIALVVEPDRRPQQQQPVDPGNRYGAPPTQAPPEPDPWGQQQAGAYGDETPF